MTAAHAVRTAAEVDALFRAGRHAEVVAAARRAAPPGWADQAAAAAAELEAAHRDAARGRVPGARWDRTPYAEYPEWVTLAALAALLAWSHGEAETCLHAPTASRPEPVHAAAWRPGLVACSSCPHLLALPRGSARDRTCDGCGRVCGPDAPLTPAVVALGLLTYAVGTCPSCTWLRAAS